MSLEVQIHEVDTHLSIIAVGQYSLANLVDLFDIVKKESEDRACQKVVLDVSEVAGTIPFLDMLELGEYCARCWRRAFEVAIVSPAGGLDSFFENVARNRGVQIAVVRNQGAAMEWL